MPKSVWFAQVQSAVSCAHVFETCVTKLIGCIIVVIAVMYIRQMQTNKTILLVRSLVDYLTVRSLHGRDVCDRA